MTAPQPNPAPSFIPAAPPGGSSQNQASQNRGPQNQAPRNQAPPVDASFTYTVVAPGPMRPVGPPGPPRPMAPYPSTRRPMSGALVTPQVTRVLVAGVALVAVVLGITLPGPVGIGWDAFLAWSIFAAVCALAVLAGAATEHRGWSWPLQLYGAGGLLLFWLIAGWPIAVSNVGFLLTFGVGCAVLSTVRNPLRPPWRAIFRTQAPQRR